MAESTVTVHLNEKRLHRASKKDEPVAYGPGLVTIPASVAEQWGLTGEPVTPTQTKKASEK